MPAFAASATNHGNAPGEGMTRVDLRRDVIVFEGRGMATIVRKHGADEYHFRVPLTVQGWRLAEALASKYVFDEELNFDAGDFQAVMDALGSLEICSGK